MNNILDILANGREGDLSSGTLDPKDIELLHKAMSAGDTTGAQTWGQTDLSAAPLKLESLEGTMKVLVATPRETPIWYKVSKRPVSNTVAEYLQLVSTGQHRYASTLEAELPETTESVYRRKPQVVKFKGVVGGATLAAQLMATGGELQSILQQEVRNRTLQMTQIQEYALMFNDSRMIPEDYNGYFAQHETENDKYASYNAYMNSEHVIDARGSILKVEHMFDATQTIRENWGMASSIITNPRVFTNFNLRYVDSMRMFPTPQHVRDGVYGNRVSELYAQNADRGGLEMIQSNFFSKGEAKNYLSPNTQMKAPAAPASVTGTVVTSPFSKFTEAQDVIYAVVAINRFGESAPTFVNGGALISVGIGQAVDFTVTPGTNSQYPVTAYAVYATEPNPVLPYNNEATKLYHLFDFSVRMLSEGYDGAPANQARENGRFMANTDRAWVTTWDGDQIFGISQVMPIAKMNLAVTNPANRFMILSYLTPQLYQPLKTVVINNLGKKL